jgi:hypothetical protein
VVSKLLKLSVGGGTQGLSGCASATSHHAGTLEHGVL